MKQVRLTAAGAFFCGVTLVIGWVGVVAVAEVPEFMRKPLPRHVRVMCYNVNWDSIFEDGDPDNHEWREYDMSDQFVRIVRAVDPDIVCVQEINPARSPNDVRAILDAAVPLGGGEQWRVHRGSDNVIASRWDLSMQRVDTIPTTNRGQAMALVGLSSGSYMRDLYLMNAHFKAGGNGSDIDRRQQHADAIVRWIGDIKSPGGYISLPADTVVMTLGDLNVYDTDPHYHVTTLVTGDIVDEGTYGPDVSPDWDGTDAGDALPWQNGSPPEFYTWRDDGGWFNPGALDRIIYTDSAVEISNSFVLNTATMSAGDLAAAGLEAADVALDLPSGLFDHLPLVVDLVLPVRPGHWDGDGDVDLDDLAPLSECMMGPGSDLCESACDVFDFDLDADVDLSDFGAFQRVFMP